jgi:hypothetical protein
MINKISFKVQGSGPEPYDVQFTKISETKLIAYCSCAAGGYGQYCKHRLNILNGDINNIVSNNVNDTKTIQEWLIGTDLESFIFTLRNTELEAENIKKKLAKIKKVVAAAMSK